MKMIIIYKDEQNRNIQHKKQFKTYTKAADFFIENYHLIIAGKIIRSNETFGYDRTELFKIFKRLGYYNGC